MIISVNASVAGIAAHIPIFGYSRDNKKNIGTKTTMPLISVNYLIGSIQYCLLPQVSQWAPRQTLSNCSKADSTRVGSLVRMPAILQLLRLMKS
ncbi:MAG: hypothetical protein HDS83_00235 [Bacteroidales bacterium]|nr:hypothetical protein [Bacteroidales bacterium]